MNNQNARIELQQQAHPLQRLDGVDLSRLGCLRQAQAPSMPRGVRRSLAAGSFNLFDEF